MQIRRLHSWDLTPKAAIDLQRSLASQIDTRSPLTRCDLIAGADISFNRFSPTMYAGVLVYRVADDQIVETQDAVMDVTFPYVPGLLSFREAPALLAAFAKLKTTPDAVMIDGHGYAHPRRFGIACHLGMWLNLPTFGCAKSLLVGKHRELAAAAGKMTPLMHNDEQVGYAVRTNCRVKPVYVSAGHRIDLASAVQVVAATLRSYRIPEPTRLAHLRVNACRRCSRA
jgi:deoxyribonuclease V